MLRPLRHFLIFATLRLATHITGYRLPGFLWTFVHLRLAVLPVLINPVRMHHHPVVMRVGVLAALVRVRQMSDRMADVGMLLLFAAVDGLVAAIPVGVEFGMLAATLCGWFGFSHRLLFRPAHRELAFLAKGP